MKDMLRSENYLIKEIKGVEETITGVVGTIRKDIRHFETLPGVAKVIPISKPYKLVSRELHPSRRSSGWAMWPSVGDRLVVIAGPCAVEDRKRTLEIARVVRRATGRCCSAAAPSNRGPRRIRSRAWARTV